MNLVHSLLRLCDFSFPGKLAETEIRVNGKEMDTIFMYCFFAILNDRVLMWNRVKSFTSLIKYLNDGALHSIKAPAFNQVFVYNDYFCISSD